MNYRHAFHAGNHADVLKHTVLLALLDALKRKPGAFFVLDTHAGRGRYELAADASRKTAEADTGIGKLRTHPALPELLQRYLQAITAHGDGIYPGSPLLAAGELRENDRLAACELQPEEAQALKALFARDPRVAVHARDGYAATKALLPPSASGTKFARGLVLIDPPYEAQDAEYPQIVTTLKEGLQRWPQATWAIWYPIKQRRRLQPFFRSIAALPARSALVVELLVRPDDSPLRLNGSGMLLLNPPWQFDREIAPALPALRQLLGENGASTRLEWLREAA
ncbi:MAG: 23S rRNA (adenine(2030)-N(6))-methyltransferase RlmJ [Pseudoxanthomonas sp.]